MKFDVLTIFPEIINDYCSKSILGRAQKAGVIKVTATNFRDFTLNKQKHVDDSPYGGGAGMVLSAEPILRALETVARPKKSKVVILSAKGKQFNQKMAYDWSKKYDQLILISGRYEGIDERVKNITRAEEISIGSFVLTDGDVAAMAVISAVGRLVSGVIKLESLAEESFMKSQILISKSQINIKSKIQKHKKLVIGNWSFGISKEYPHYTRPEVLEYKGKKYRVPKVLLSGDHKKIEEWRKKKAK
jgi:tRNA (guanine37-N1)-methyltransferase